MSALKFGRRQPFRRGILVAAIATGFAILASGTVRAESILVTSYGDNTLTEYNLSTGASTVLVSASSGLLDQPDGVAISPTDGSIYVSNGSNPDGPGTIEHFSSTGTLLGTGTVVFNANTAQFPTASPGAFAPLAAPATLRFGSDGDLYVVDNGGTQLQKFSLCTNTMTGVTTATFQGAPITGLGYGGGIALGPGGAVYGGSFAFGTVYKAGNSTPVLQAVAPSGLLYLPGGTAGSLLVSNLYSGYNPVTFQPIPGNQVLKYDLSNPTTPTVFATTELFPEDLQVDPATGNILIDALGPEYTSPTGSISEFAPDGTPVVASSSEPFLSLLSFLDSPSAFAIIPDVASVPEPTNSAALVGLCGMGLLCFIRSRKSARSGIRSPVVAREC